MSKPKRNEYPTYFDRYISLVQADSVSEAITIYTDKLISFIRSIPDERAAFRYSSEKWTVKEVVQHILDTERVFAYRALAVARGEIQILPGFEQDDYASQSHSEKRSLDDLKEEFEALRYSNNILFRSFSYEDLDKMGSISDYKMSVNALIFTTFGHIIYHQNILQKFYLL